MQHYNHYNCTFLNITKILILLKYVQLEHTRINAYTLEAALIQIWADTDFINVLKIKDLEFYHSGGILFSGVLYRTSVF